jgi:basic membrane protein A and related proteins
MRGIKRGLALFASLALMSCGNKGSQGVGIQHMDIILVTEGSGIEDKSFNAAAWRGITGHFGDTPASATQRGTRYQTLHSASQDQIENNINLATDEEPGLVMGTGFTFAQPIHRTAAVNPQQNYLIIDETDGGLANVRGVLFKEHEGSFLVGAAVALQSLEDGVVDPKFGFLGGMQGDVITRFELGFIQGVHSILPNAIIEDFYADSWGSPEIGKIRAKSWYDNGFYAIFSAAGGTGSGVIAEAKEQRMAGRNVWAIGVDSDQYEDGIYGDNGESAVLTSMLKLVERAVGDALTDIDNKRFEGGNRLYGLAEDGVGFATTNPALSPLVIEQVNAWQARIKSGALSVIGSDTEARNAGIVPAGLVIS